MRRLPPFLRANRIGAPYGLLLGYILPESKNVCICCFNSVSLTLSKGYIFFFGGSNCSSLEACRIWISSDNYFCLLGILVLQTQLGIFVLVFLVIILQCLRYGLLFPRCHHRLRGLIGVCSWGQICHPLVVPHLCLVPWWSHQSTRTVSFSHPVWIILVYIFRPFPGRRQNTEFGQQHHYQGRNCPNPALIMPHAPCVYASF